MSNEEKNGVSTAAEAVTNNVHTEAAQAIVADIRKFRERIPRLVIPVSKKDAARLRTAASVPAEFVELTNLAVANENELVRGGAATPAEVRDSLDYADAVEPIADELEALAQFVRHSATAARNKAGKAALLTYALAQRLARQPETAHLAPYVAQMRRALDRRKKLTPEAAADRAAKAAERAAAKAAKAAARVAATTAATP
jgi:hypothetical protein